MATLTASLAQSTVTPAMVHTGNTLSGRYSGAFSTSGSGILLLAKIPAYAKTAQLVFSMQDEQTTMVANFGIRSGVSTSADVSAFYASATGPNVTRVSKVFDCVANRDETLNESFKYVVATLATGTKAASAVIEYSINLTY